MTAETSPDALALAFAPPEARARATATPPFPDRLSLRDHVVETEIGAYQPERGRRQRLAFNVVVEVRPARGAPDDVDRILSYDRIVEAIAQALDAERVNLLETLAERIALRLLAAPQALRVFVRIEKLDLGPGALGVEIVRDRAGPMPAPGGAADEAPRPVVVFLSNAALAAPRLGAWLDALEGRAVVLCVGPPDLPPPETGAPGADRRIGLLAIEQTAWRLAARDPRCTVTATRSELDWATARGRLPVWAPSKMVLDATRPPAGIAPAELVPWLARSLAAPRIVAVGADIPGAELRGLNAEALL